MYARCETSHARRIGDPSTATSTSADYHSISGANMSERAASSDCRRHQPSSYFINDVSLHPQTIKYLRHYLVRH